MSKPSSHDNSLSSSSQSAEVEAQRERRAIALLPTAYPFELTKAYQAAFARDDAALALPASYRLAMWQKYVADPHWLRVQEETAKNNRRLEREYDAKVAEIVAENRARQERYEAQEARYKAARTEYVEKCKAYDEQVANELLRIKEIVKERARYNLEWDITQQSGTISQAIDHVCSLVTNEIKQQDGVRHIKFLLGAGALTLPSPFFWVGSLFALVAYSARREAIATTRRTLARSLTCYHYNWYQKRSTARTLGIENLYDFSLAEQYQFALEDENEFTLEDLTEANKYRVYTPVYFPVATAGPGDGESCEEANPLGCYPDNAFDVPSTLLSGVVGCVVSAVPILGLLWNLGTSDAIEEEVRVIKASKLSIDAIQTYRRETLTKLLEHELTKPEVIDYLVEQNRQEMKTYEKPSPPESPTTPRRLPLPSPPIRETAVPLKPPQECFDMPEKHPIEHVFKGSRIYGIDEVSTLARTHLFAGDKVHPHFQFGGAAFPIRGNSPHMLVVGTTGSGKTTTLLKLMSSLLPLSRAQAERLASRLLNGDAAFPESSHQWGRSQTHQAVVYNAKGEYVNYLKAFGFDSEVDLFNLDPADPSGYAWDVAGDIDDRDSIKKFAEQLIPKSVKASQDASTEFWYGTARGVLEAIIVSFRNAARREGKEPSWTLRDLVKAARNEEYVKYVLRWHDTPFEAVQEFFGLAEAQASSVMMTLRQCMRDYDLVAERWHHAKSRGRSISLKKWSLEGGQSVVVLPNTMENVASYGPLNKAVMKALAATWLSDHYSFYIDEQGKQQKRHRFLIIDEFGEAGQFDELKRIMGQGRTFGVHVVLGLHQLSQVRDAYGEEGAETIVGLCPYKACLKSDDVRTQKWMSELIGNCLRSYEKTSFTYSTSNGVTITQSTNESEGGSEGTNESTSKSSTKGTSGTTGSSESHTDSKQQSSTSAPKPGERGTATTGTGESNSQTTNRSHTDNASTTDGKNTGTSEQTNWSSSTGQSVARNRTGNKGSSTTRELRGEPAIEPHEFGGFPDPETSGECEGVYITPTLPVFRSRLRMAQVQPEYEFPEKLNSASVRRDEEDDEVVSRRVQWDQHDLERLYLDKPHALPEIPNMLVPPLTTPVNKPLISRIEEEPLLERPDEPDDNEPPLADFEF